ncbi:MAG TPA: RIP metalloprotease RseP, partial [Candidatus Wolfebacteria bacterium]|nr:RIP metalloprotease RseP [Candidatus Wolfebacteria bacterium]
FFVGLPQAIFITEVVPDSPAAEIGLIVGDKITNFLKLDEFIEYVNDNKGKEIGLEIERLGKVFSVQAVPRINPPKGQGALGVALVEGGSPKMGLFSSFYEGFKSSIGIIESIAVAIFGLIKSAVVGEATMESVAGPVGIVKITAQAGSLGFIYLLQLLALISLNLAVINIIPFPALDGGRLLFLAIEKIKGSPLNPKFERFANAGGMALLLLLMLLITIKDISRFF